MDGVSVCGLTIWVVRCKGPVAAVDSLPADGPRMGVRGVWDSVLGMCGSMGGDDEAGRPVLQQHT